METNNLQEATTEPALAEPAPLNEIAIPISIEQLVPPVSIPLPQQITHEQVIPQATKEQVLGVQPPEQEEASKDDWKCTACSKTFDYRSRLIAHIEKYHADTSTTLIASLPPTTRRTFKKTSASNPQQQQQGTVAPDFSGIPTAAKPVVRVDYKTTASMLFDVATNGLAVGLGPEWIAKDASEKETVVEPLAAYLETKEVKDIPPGVILVYMIAIYAAPRLREPSTSGKIKLAWQWMKSKLGKRK